MNEDFYEVKRVQVRIKQLITLDGVEYHINDIVRIDTPEKVIIGRVENIESSHMAIDSSEEFNSQVRRVYYSNMEKISKLR